MPSNKTFLTISEAPLNVNKTFQAISEAHTESLDKKTAVTASLRSVLEQATRAGFSGGVLTTIAQAIQCAEFEIQSDSNIMPNGDRVD